MLQTGRYPVEEQRVRENALARKHHTWKNSLWSAVGKNPLRRRAALMPCVRNRIQRQVNQMLELAKGFEPPTL